MITAGITGGIGSGKSVVTRIFRLLGIPVYDSDAEAKNLYEKNPEITAKIFREISPDVEDKNGRLDRKKLAGIVFTDPELLVKLNRIVHPYVKKDYENWRKDQSSVYVIREAAILFESGLYKDCKMIISVYAPVELRIQRVRERDRRTRAEVEGIIASQMTDEERILKSDFVIRNDETQLIIPQVLSIHEKILEIAATEDQHSETVK